MNHESADRRVVPLGAVTAVTDLWPRAGHDETRVAHFIELYRADGLTALPPLDVVADRDDLLLADGWHRHQALRVLRSPDALVCVLPASGDPRDQAYRHGIATAASTALPLNRAERRAAVTRVLAEHPHMADREIARLVGVSPTTVGTARQRLTEPTDTGGEEPLDEAYLAEVTAEDLAKRLVSSIDKLWDARGVTESLLGDRTGRRLATALRGRHGDEALSWARRFAAWSERCVRELESTESATRR